MSGLKEGVEGRDLVKYLKDLISGRKGTDGIVDISIVSTFRIGLFKPSQRYPRDIIKLPSWETKGAILR